MCACAHAEKLCSSRCTGTAASYQARRKKEAYASSDDVDKTTTFGIYGYRASPKPSGSGQKCREEITNH